MQRLKECRLKANMTQQYVALTLGIKPPSVSNWESGKTQPTMDNLIELARLYNVTTDYLLGLSDSAVAENDGTDAAEEEKEEVLIRGFRILPVDVQQEILDFVKFKGGNIK